VERKITITISGIPGAGKSTIAALIGRCLKLTGSNVIFVDDEIAASIEKKMFGNPLEAELETVLVFIESDVLPDEVSVMKKRRG
jgi:adenylylsulfate kinase-like enzyme